MKSWPPDASVEAISWNDTSKLMLEYCRTRAAGRNERRASCQSMRLAIARWGISTPFGRPVDPDVNTMNTARLRVDVDVDHGLVSGGPRWSSSSDSASSSQTLTFAPVEAIQSW